MRGSWGGEGNVALNTENREGEGVGACHYTGEWKGWIKEFCRSLLVKPNESKQGEPRI